MTEAKKKTKIAPKILIPLLILVIGIGGFKLMGKLKKVPQRQQTVQQGLLVDVMELKTTTHQVIVHASGTVQAEQEIALVPEISGKVIWISPQLVGGGLFQQGETLLQIDPIDYELALEKAYASIAQVKVAMATEHERAKVSLAEWNRIDLSDKGEPGPLITREIQLQQQQANLTSAQATLRQAEINLQRTKITAPFNGRIRQEQVDLGQYVRAGTSIGSFAGTDHAEIHIPLPLNELDWLNIRSTSPQKGSAASIYLPGNHNINWSGKLVRSLGEIDPNNRMATVMVRVNDPYQLKPGAEQPILTNGMFVDIELHGEKFDNIISIPRKALNANNSVWLADNNNQLKQRTVDVLRREKQQILLRGGVEAGEKLVLTTISGATDGTLLRPVMQEIQP